MLVVSGYTPGCVVIPSSCIPSPLIIFRKKCMFFSRYRTLCKASPKQPKLFSAALEEVKLEERSVKEVP